MEDQTEDAPVEDDASVWEYRAAGMALINALVNGSNELEERMALREEFARRGLNEVMTVSPARVGNIVAIADLAKDAALHQST